MAQQGQGHLGADDRCGLNKALFFRRAGHGGAASTAWTVGGTWIDEAACPRRYSPGWPDQRVDLDQGAHALLQEEGITLGAGNEELFERLQVGLVPEQGLEEGVGRTTGSNGSS